MTGTGKVRDDSVAQPLRAVAMDAAISSPRFVEVLNGVFSLYGLTGMVNGSSVQLYATNYTLTDLDLA